MPYDHYISLGDSMSLDVYPALDAGAAEVAVALEWNATAGAVAPLGAASQLMANDDERWPEFMGRDLTTFFPRITHQQLAGDGATIGDVFGEQLPAVEEDEREVLVTLTAGLTDLLSAVGNRPRRALLPGVVRDIALAYEHLVGAIRERLPRATIVVTTLYDPSDRSGRIPGVLEEAGPLPLDQLDALNARLRALAAHHPDVRLADAYAHFLGHGTSVAEKERWYWRRSLIEPSAVGASELRRVWLEAVGL